VISAAEIVHAELQAMGDAATIRRDGLVTDLKSICPNRRLGSIRQLVDAEATVSELSSFLSSIADPAKSGFVSADLNVPNENEATGSELSSFLSSIADPAKSGFISADVNVSNENEATGSELSSFLSSIADPPKSGSADLNVPPVARFPAPTAPGPTAPGPTTGNNPIEAEIESAITALTKLEDFIATELDDGQNGINAAMKMAQTFSDSVNQAGSPKAAAIIFAFPWFLVPFALVLTVALVHTGKCKPRMVQIVSKYMMPFFCLLTLVSAILAVVMVSYAIANAGKMLFSVLFEIAFVSRL